MLSRIYQSARSLVYNPRTKSRHFSPSPNRVMVTANMKHVPSEEEDLNDDNTINVFVPPPSTKRRKRAELERSDVEEVKIATPSPKKRKVLPVRMKDGEDELLSNSRPVVEVPARKMTPKAEVASAEAQQSSKKTHRRFDSEEPTEEFFSTVREQAVVDDAEEEEEESDDDAPEAIGMQEAAQTIKSKEQDAAKAVKEQKAAARQKRKDRDEALRTQSQAAKKRKPKTKAEKVAIDSDSDSAEGDVAIEAATSEAEDGVPSKAMRNTQVLPDLLPLEFLEDDEPSDVMAIQEPTKAVSKKHKFKDASEKKPKDRRIGATTYRVTKSQSTNLPPKAANNARSVKESWLQGRSGTKIDPSRKPFSKGFFKK